jgi:hypothetical protein
MENRKTDFYLVHPSKIHRLTPKPVLDNLTSCLVSQIVSPSPAQRSVNPGAKKAVSHQ